MARGIGPATGHRYWATLLAWLLLACGVGLLAKHIWTDEALSPDVQSALQLPRRLPPEVNLFNAVSGFAVAKGKNPAQEGYAAVTRVNALLAAAPHGDGTAFSGRLRNAWVKSELTVQDHAGVLCSPKVDGCLSTLRARRDTLQVLARGHSTLLQRYRNLVTFPAYRMELRPHVNMPLPDFETLRKTHRLWLGLQVATHSARGKETVAAVLGDLEFLRRLLAQADDLLIKMVVTDMVAEALHVVAAFMDTHRAPLSSFPALAPLNDREATLTLALRSEFRFGASALLMLETRTETYEQLGLPVWLGATALRPLYKPNRSTNRAYRCWEGLGAATESMHPEPSALGLSGTITDCSPDWLEWIRNPVGGALVSVARPDIGRYAGNLRDLSGLITLVNLKLAIRRAGITEDRLEHYLTGVGAQFTDPYQGKPMLWQRKSRTLHFNSPQSKRGYHRLPLQPFG
ncbi:MAG: hypothetical protein QNJ82_18440 [Gammaproteobacteria bacterium]|nr:hypothetical protein [Gammaproteobacteria bacterium]